MVILFFQNLIENKFKIILIFIKIGLIYIQKKLNRLEMRFITLILILNLFLRKLVYLKKSYLKQVFLMLTLKNY